MSRPAAATDTLPPTARSIALLLASTPTVQDAQPGVLHQLLEFSHRYTSQVLSDALVYSEFAGHPGKVDMDDVTLAVQARVGWEFGGRIPKEYTLSLASQINAAPLPAVPEVFGVRLPPASESLTSVSFDLIPNKPPSGTKTYDEEVEEIEESESDDEDMEPAAIPAPTSTVDPVPTPQISGPVNTVVPDVDMARPGADEGSDGAEEEDGLFAGGDDEEEEEESAPEDDAMEEVVSQGANGGGSGVKRKLVEEDDYD